MKRIADTATINDTVTMAKLDRNLSRVRTEIDSLKTLVPEGFPIGWKAADTDWLKHIPGWLASILAICLGATFLV